MSASGPRAGKMQRASPARPFPHAAHAASRVGRRPPAHAVPQPYEPAAGRLVRQQVERAGRGGLRRASMPGPPAARTGGEAGVNKETDPRPAAPPPAGLRRVSRRCPPVRSGRPGNGRVRPTPRRGRRVRRRAPTPRPPGPSPSVACAGHAAPVRPTSDRHPAGRPTGGHGPCRRPRRAAGRHGRGRDAEPCPAPFPAPGWCRLRPG